MHAFICTTCGTQFAAAHAPPARCVICEDERQYVPPSGQGWTTLDRLAIVHRNAWHEYEHDILGIGIEPRFAIGQRALLLRTAAGNVLWDCIALLDEASVTLIRALGGLQAMAISHPHFYTTMVEWGRAFDVPVYVQAADRQWIMRPDPVIRHWEGERFELLRGVTLIHGAGHFPGSSLLHWAGGAGGRGVLCSADTATVGRDRKSLAFMRSYPNYIPLSAGEVKAIAAALAGFEFDAIYGLDFESVIPTGGKAALQDSVARHLAAIDGR